MRQLILLAVFLAAAIPFSRATAAPRQQPEEKQVLGAPSEIDLEGEGAGFVGVEPGTRLLRRPYARSAPVARVDVRLELPVLERREGWLRVRYGAFTGWIPADGGAGAAGDRPPPPPASPDVESLARARALLGIEPEPAGRLGPYELHTDVRDRKLLRLLAAIASRLPEAYRERYGLDPGAGGSDAVVIFSTEEGYRAFAAAESAVTDPGILGHASPGLAVLFVGLQERDEVAAVLVHELSHLLGRRTLGPALPPWLDEGMANDLAFCRTDGSGRLRLGTLGGRSVVIEEPTYRPGGWLDVDRAVHLSGPTASLSLVQKRWHAGEALPLALLTDLLPSEFFIPEDRQNRYDASAFFVRYLLDGEDGDLAAPFRAFLAALAADGGAEPAALLAHLGRGWPELDRGFGAWLDGQRVSPRPDEP